LVGGSIGAWRMATACLPDANAGFAQLAHDYITQDYPHAPGQLPAPAVVSALFRRQIERSFGGRESAVLGHARYRLHIFTSRGRHVLRREGKLRTPLGYLGAFAANALSRRAMGAWLERVVFSDPRDPLPLRLQRYRTRRVALTPENLQLGMLASCSIPFVLQAVHDIPGAPRGAYWDGGITDYHLHLDYATLRDANESRDSALVLYPHFQDTVVPGWLDKPFLRRHRATPDLDNVVLLSPTPEFVRSLPNAKLPDRTDFKRYVDDPKARIVAWQTAVRESERLRDQFVRWLERADAGSVLPLR
ncbi:MAG: phospholipase, partial [Burkholderiaceae bacterium]